MISAVAYRLAFGSRAGLDSLSHRSAVFGSPIWKIYHVIDLSPIFLFTMLTSSRRPVF